MSISSRGPFPGRIQAQKKGNEKVALDNDQLSTSFSSSYGPVKKARNKRHAKAVPLPNTADVNDKSKKNSGDSLLSALDALVDEGPRNLVVPDLPPDDDVPGVTTTNTTTSTTSATSTSTSTPTSTSAVATTSKSITKKDWGAVPAKQSKKEKMQTKRQNFLSKLMLPGEKQKFAVKPTKEATSLSLEDLSSSLPSSSSSSIIGITPTTQAARLALTRQEMSHYTQVLSHPAFVRDPMAAIKEHLLLSQQKEWNKEQAEQQTEKRLQQAKHQRAKEKQGDKEDAKDPHKNALSRRKKVTAKKKRKQD